MPLQWNIQAGQHVQLWMPRSGYRSCFHLPLFYVANIGEQQQQINGTPSSYRRLHFLVRYRRGLTKRLAFDAIKANCSFPVFVFGPFGHPPCFGDYGTVVFVVEDIGLFRILPFIRQLVHGSRRRETVVRKLEILWAVDWSSIVELELLPEPKGVEASLSANHVPEIFERSRYKSWIWNSIQHLFELDRQHNHTLDSGDTQASVRSTSIGQQQMRLGETGGFDVSAEALGVVSRAANSSQILQMRIYCADAPENSHGRFPQSRRIESLFEGFIAARKVEEYIENQCGKMIITGR